MGAGISSNTANQYINAVTNIATKMINDTSVQTLQSQGIVVKNAQSDVIIEGNHFNQSIQIDLQALLNAIASQSAQQDLMQELSQLAESTNKQLNLFQFADANNTLNQYLDATINLSTNITQTCTALAQQNQYINVDTASGVVKINNNTFNQTEDIISKCMYQATSSSDAIQKAQQQADQSAKATNVGINIWAIVVMVLLGLLAMILPELLPFLIPLFELSMAVTSVIKIVFNLFFLLLFLAGLGLIICYFLQTKNIISLDGDVKPISSETQCGATKVDTTDVFKNPEDAGNECLDKNYAAFDFDQTDTTTTFYSKVSPSCEKILISNDNSTKTSDPPIVPKINSTLYSNLPDVSLFNYKDAIFIQDGTMQICNMNDSDQKVWDPVKDDSGNAIHYFDISGITSDQFKIMYNTLPSTWPDPSIKVIVFVPPITSDMGTEYRVYTDPNNLQSYVSKKPPSLYNYGTNPDNKILYWSGFNIKVKKLNIFFLYLSIVFMIVGFFGFILQFSKKKTVVSKKKTQSGIH